MKAVPILVITNALALGLAIVLYVRQGALESQMGARRTEGSRTEVVDTSGIEMRLEQLERRYLGESGQASAPATGAAPADPSFAAPQPGAGDAQGGGPPAAGSSEEFDPQEMEVFRKKVRKSNDLNQEEDQFNAIASRLDELVKTNKIGPLTPSQREAVARIALRQRRRMPEIWRKLRESGTLETANREDRGRILRVEHETLRVETQRALEEIIPAADAKTIVEEAVRDRGAFPGFGGAVPPAPGVAGR
jgi:hypothetical protein